MRVVRSLLMAVVLMGLATAGFAQAYGDDAKSSSTGGDMTSTLQAQEIKVIEAVKNQDSKAFLSMVDPDAWSIDAMGFTPVSEVAGMLKDIVMKSYSIEGYKVRKLAPDTYVAGFTWKGDCTYKGQAYPPVAYCSTIWTKQGKQWKAVSHQESNPMPGMPEPTSASH